VTSRWRRSNGRSTEKTGARLAGFADSASSRGACVYCRGSISCTCPPSRTGNAGFTRHLGVGVDRGGVREVVERRPPQNVTPPVAKTLKASPTRFWVS
jgi:hypothetical protein